MERRTSSVANTVKKESVTNTEVDAEDIQKKESRGIMKFACLNSMKVLVLCILCLQNSMFTILRRYSQGVLKEVYSKVRINLRDVIDIGPRVFHYLLIPLCCGTICTFSMKSCLLAKSSKWYSLHG
jgi:hypothetical protein